MYGIPLLTVRILSFSRSRPDIKSITSEKYAHLHFFGIENGAFARQRSI